MLIGFSVSNFLSFNETQSISFVASKVVRHKEHIYESKNNRILKGGLIFGANASGKTNLIKAIDFSKKIIVNGLGKVNSDKKYFRVKEGNYSVPGVFQFELMVNNTIFSYGFAISYRKKEIVAEWLIKHGVTNEKYIFSREVDEDGNDIVGTQININSEVENTRFNVYLEDFRNAKETNLRKKLILSDLSERSNSNSGIFKDIADVYKWFERMIIIFPYTKYGALGNVVADEDKKGLFLKLLMYFDTGIEGIAGSQIEFEKALEDLPENIIEKIKIDISDKVQQNKVRVEVENKMITLYKDELGNLVASKMLLNHGNDNDLFDSEDESDGTKRLFDLIPLFMQQQKKRVILIDEIDRSLHTRLTHKFVEMFYDMSKGDETQLIVSTHDSSLLDLDLVRQDEIWFVERTSDHSSKIYSLNKFKQRFDKKVEKDYLLGRYGAIPIFSEELLVFEEE